MTQAARTWVESRLPEHCQYFGSAVAVEPRYVAAIAEGISGDGLRIEEER